MLHESLIDDYNEDSDYLNSKNLFNRSWKLETDKFDTFKIH